MNENDRYTDPPKRVPSVKKAFLQLLTIVVVIIGALALLASCGLVAEMLSRPIR